MATSDNVRAVSREAGSAVQIYRFVVQDSGDGQYDHVSGAQGRMDGICGETVAAAGDVFPMVVDDSGIAKVEAGAAISLDALLASDTVGRAITAVSGVGNFRAGRALDAAAGAGEIIRLQFRIDEDQVL